MCLQTNREAAGERTEPNPCRDIRSAQLFSDALERCHFASGAVIVMIIGLLQRLGILMISEGEEEGFFLTTIGNINWYTGYLSVMYPLMIGLFLAEEKREKRSVVLYCLLVVTAGLACITNGSNSVYLMMAAVLVCAGLLSLFSRERYYRFTLVLAMTGIAFELVSLYVSLDPSEWFFSAITTTSAWN